MHLRGSFSLLIGINVPLRKLSKKSDITKTNIKFIKENKRKVELISPKYTINELAKSNINYFS